MHVTPICESGQKANLSNCRLISILSVFKYYYNVICLLEITQHGNLIFNIMETCYRNIDECELNVSILLDLEKAFDKIHHDIL